MAKKLLFIIVLPLLVVATFGCRPSGSNDAFPGLIKTEVPPRAEGQEHMVGFFVPALDTVRIGVIGLGMRGPDAVDRFCYIPGAKVVALCDLHQERVEKANEILTRHELPEAAEYYGSDDAWRELVERDDLDLIYSNQLANSCADGTLCNGARKACGDRSPCSPFARGYMGADRYFGADA